MNNEHNYFYCLPKCSHLYYHYMHSTDIYVGFAFFSSGRFILKGLFYGSFVLWGALFSDGFGHRVVERIIRKGVLS